MNYDVRLEQHPGQPLAVVRRRASQSELSKVVPPLRELAATG